MVRYWKQFEKTRDLVVLVSNDLKTAKDITSWQWQIKRLHLQSDAPQTLHSVLVANSSDGRIWITDSWVLVGISSMVGPIILKDTPLVKSFQTWGFNSKIEILLHEWESVVRLRLQKRILWKSGLWKNRSCHEINTSNNQSIHQLNQACIRPLIQSIRQSIIKWGNQSTNY